MRLHNVLLHVLFEKTDSFEGKTENALPVFGKLLIRECDSDGTIVLQDWIRLNTAERTQKHDSLSVDATYWVRVSGEIRLEGNDEVKIASRGGEERTRWTSFFTWRRSNSFQTEMCKRQEERTELVRFAAAGIYPAVCFLLQQARHFELH
jgi:hypothetical protein